MKLISLDVGTKRIGVAKADSNVKIAIPYSTFVVDGTEFEQIAKLSRLYGTEFFVLGLPRNSKGEETAQSQYVRDFATKLQSVIPGAKIAFQDESLTSVEAENRLKSRKKSYAKGDIDCEAAVIILQDFLENIQNGAEKRFKMPERVVKPDENPVVEISPRQIKKARKKNAPKAAKAPKKRLIAIIAIILVVVLGATSGALWYSQALNPVAVSNCSEDITSDACKYITFPVDSGESTAEIAAHLESVGLIKSGLAFRIYAKLSGQSGDFKAGDYEFRKAMSVQEIVTMIVKGSTTGNVFRLTILPGETVASIKEKLINFGYSEEEVDAALTADYDHPALASKPTGASLEGYIFGETYEFYVGESVENILLTTFDELYRVIRTNDLVAKFEAQGLTLHEGITLASVVQKEASTLDQPTVAQIFLSRLSIGMALGSDVTTQYALDQIDPERKTYTDNQSALKVEECHNTRLYTGLPCGPISNPGASALLAVAEPSNTSYLYFLTGDDGVMYYSYTEAEHNQNVVSHCQVLCNVSL